MSNLWIIVCNSSAGSLYWRLYADVDEGAHILLSILVSGNKQLSSLLGILNAFVLWIKHINLISLSLKYIYNYPNRPFRIKHACDIISIEEWWCFYCLESRNSMQVNRSFWITNVKLSVKSHRRITVASSKFSLPF